MYGGEEVAIAVPSMSTARIDFPMAAIIDLIAQEARKILQQIGIIALSLKVRFQKEVIAFFETSPRNIKK